MTRLGSLRSLLLRLLFVFSYLALGTYLIWGSTHHGQLIVVDHTLPGLMLTVETMVEFLSSPADDTQNVLSGTLAVSMLVFSIGGAANAVLLMMRTGISSHRYMMTMTHLCFACVTLAWALVSLMARRCKVAACVTPAMGSVTCFSIFVMFLGHRVDDVVIERGHSFMKVNCVAAGIAFASIAMNRFVLQSRIIAHLAICAIGCACLGIDMWRSIVWTWRSKFGKDGHPNDEENVKCITQLISAAMLGISIIFIGRLSYHFRSQRNKGTSTISEVDPSACAEVDPIVIGGGRHCKGEEHDADDPTVAEASP